MKDKSAYLDVYVLMQFLHVCLIYAVWVNLVMSLVYFSAMQNGTSDMHDEFGNDEKETNDETELEEVVVDNPVSG